MLKYLNPVWHFYRYTASMPYMPLKSGPGAFYRLVVGLVLTGYATEYCGVGRIHAWEKHLTEQKYKNYYESIHGKDDHGHH